MHKLAWTCAVSLLCACGSGSSVSGTVNGQGLSVHDAFFFPNSFGTGTAATTTLLVSLTSFSGACADFESDTRIPNSTFLTLEVSEAGTTPVGPGTYTVPSPATAQLFQVQPNCDEYPSSATQGSFVLETLTATQATGTFSLSFGSDTLTGKFDAAACGSSTGAMTTCG